MTRESSIRLAAERARNHNKNGRHKLARTIARQLLASAEDPKNDDERAGIEMAREELGIAEFCMFPDNDNSQQLVEWWGKERNVDRGLRFAYRVLREGSPDAAARCFASLEKLDTRSVYAFYRRAMETFCSLRNAERTPLKRHRQPWLIHLPAWGYKYGRTLAQYVLPSLLAEGNLPSVASRRDVYLMIHSDHCTAELIGMSEIMTRLETLATVEFQCFDTEILDLMETASEDPCVQSSHLKYNFYGLSQVLALNAALKDSADVSFFLRMS